MQRREKEGKINVKKIKKKSKEKKDYRGKEEI